MKLHELLGNQCLMEQVHTINGNVASVKELNKLKNYAEVNVVGNVDLSNRKIRKLPVNFGTVSGLFYCYSNELTSLKGAPRKIGSIFSCNENQLTSLEGAPQEIGGAFNCADNELISLEGIHKIIKKINGNFNCFRNPIKSGGIGLILIEGLRSISTDHPALKIIAKYLGQGKKGLLLCQDELIEAGYEEFAKL